MAPDMYHLLSVLRLEAGLDSSLQHEAGYSDEHFHEGDDDDWDDDDDVEVIYVRE